MPGKWSDGCGVGEEEKLGEKEKKNDTNSTSDSEDMFNSFYQDATIRIFHSFSHPQHLHIIYQHHIWA